MKEPILITSPNVSRPNDRFGFYMKIVVLLRLIWQMISMLCDAQKCSCKMLCVVKKSLWKLDIFISMHVGLMMLAKVFFFTTKIRFFIK